MIVSLIDNNGINQITIKIINMKITCSDKKVEKRLDEVFEQMAERLDFNMSFEEVSIMMDLDSNTLCITPIKNES